jgi:translation initiation factor IF-2
MSGIDRVLAAILLVGAVGGTAAFARQIGSDSSAEAVSLTAPPLQHFAAPGSVLFAHTPAPIRVAVDVRRRSRHAPTAIRPLFVAAVPPRTPAPKRAPKRVATRAATAAPEPAPAPVSPPEPPRVLAAVLTPAQPATEAPATEAPTTDAKTHGRALGHVKQHGHNAPTVADAPAAPAATDTAVAQQPLEPTPIDPGGPAQGNGSGHTKARATPDGD